VFVIAGDDADSTLTDSITMHQGLLSQSGRNGNERFVALPFYANRAGMV
jgi:hypothetical protein